MPTRPPTFHERFLGGRKATDAAYNRARAHDPTEQALHGARWQKLRKMALLRDGFLCQPCRRTGRVKLAKDVDHIRPRHTHPDLMWDLDNVESICRSCHNAKTHGEREVR